MAEGPEPRAGTPEPEDRSDPSVRGDLDLERPSHAVASRGDEILAPEAPNADISNADAVGEDAAEDPESPDHGGGPRMVAGCLAFAVISLALVGGAIFALVVALSGSSPGPSVAASTTHPAGATSGPRSGSGEPTSASTSTTTTTAPGGSATTTAPASAPGVVPTTLPVLGGSPTTMPMSGTSAPGSATPSLIPQAGASCTADQVGVTVRLPDGSLITCEASGPSSQWVPISG